MVLDSQQYKNRSNDDEYRKRTDWGYTNENERKGCEAIVGGVEDSVIK